MDMFEQNVFGKLSKLIKSVRKTACPDTEFVSDVYNTALNFNSLKKLDSKIKVYQNEQGYDIRLSKPHLAFDFNTLMSQDNEDINLVFTDELLQFEPDEELIHKSSVPLWVICPLQGGHRVLLKRAW